jgi:hypothetical protein
MVNSRVYRGDMLALEIYRYADMIVVNRRRVTVLYAIISDQAR